MVHGSRCLIPVISYTWILSLEKMYIEGQALYYFTVMQLENRRIEDADIKRLDKSSMFLGHPCGVRPRGDQGTYQVTL